jgi:hypothetical protein
MDSDPGLPEVADARERQVNVMSSMAVNHPKR